jgi:DHA2 family multidrug resistance protein
MTGWRAWVGFTAMTAGMFLAILDIQIVASSLIDIQFALKIPAERLSYLQTTYLIAEIIAIAVTGWLTRVMSTRWLFVTAITGFVLASVACAASESYLSLYAWRFIQGLFGGAVIPVIFSAVFLMFPARQQPIATVIGGGLAMLAPSVGPYIGGWITETFSWHWLFLINIVPGLLVAAIAAVFVRCDTPKWELAKRLDYIALGLIAVFLASLELFLKESPRLGWITAWPLTLAAVCIASGAIFLRRCRGSDPLVDLSVFRERTFVAGAWFSFVLGMALFGATYLMPLFLGIVRDHGPFETGTIMIVTGIAQLLAAPIATVLETRVPVRTLTAVGFALLTAGMVWNGFATFEWDFNELFIPQILRGAAFMLCLLPITRLALGNIAPEQVSNASALFNLMRNIGGAVGLALIDTIIENRPAYHVEAMVERLQAGDRATAIYVGLPLDKFNGTPLGPIDDDTRAMVEPLVKRAAAVSSFNEGWLLLAALVAVSLLVLFWLRPARRER